MNELAIHLKPSRQLALIFSVAHTGCLIIVWLLDITLLLKIFSTLLLLFSMIYYIQRFALLQTPHAIVAFYLSDAASCIIQTRSNDHHHYQVQGSTYVTPHLTVICLKSKASFFERSIVIFPDSIDAEKFRQLRVWLRWKWKETNAGD